MNVKTIKIISFLLSVISLVTLAGCGVQNAQINWYDFNAKYSYLENCKVAENDKYQLLWDSETASITIYDKKHDKFYSNIPQNVADTTTQPTVYSAVSVSYIEGATLNTNSADSFSASSKKKSFTAKRIDNGIKVTYYFEKIAISVPVSYTLRDNCINVSIDPAEIGEDEQLCYKITLMPFMCSVLNTDSKDGHYLFVPSGSGALIYPKQTGEGITSIISNSIYGDNEQNIVPTQTQDVRLPIYGVKNDDTGVFAIISGAEDTAEITTNVGSSTYGYSSVYSTFKIRGSQLTSTTGIKGNGEKTLFCKGKTSDIISVDFYPLYGDEANYNGMAKIYRNYLSAKKGLKKKNDDTLLNIKFIGGVQTTRFIFGTPYKSLLVLTDFSDVDTITNELYEKYKTKININLLGFGKTGMDLSEVAGNSTYNKKFGSIKKLSDLKDNKDISVYFNFDVLRFEKYGNSVNVFNGAARSAIGAKNAMRYSKVAIPEIDWSESVYRMVRRGLVDKISDKCINKTVKWNVDGISLNTLTEMSYSDYSDAEYYAKSNTTKQSTGILNRAKARKLKIAASGTNAYAAVCADQIFDTPFRSSQYQVYDTDIPFYQMVFKGYVPMSTQSLNILESHDTALLKAIETGIGLQYTLISDYQTDLIDSKQNYYYSSKYDDNKSVIMSDIKSYSSIFKKVSNVGISNHYILGDKVNMTEFENGIKVVVNYSDKDFESEYGTVPTNGFLIKEE